MTLEKFKKVATYQYSSEAIIFKGKLESEGISVYMRDNLTIDTDPLVSNAIGGVKLYVEYDDYEKALSILGEIPKFAMSDNGSLIACPNCKANEVQLLTIVDDAKSFFSMLFALMLVVLPFYIKRKYKCDACGHQFENEK
ncbi:DUF2007 domain-containing protein [Flavobacterium chuncheonense]|uniref:DUF2007 domain-containing protein n=1 Tax=Flavobacterium chuncheonense TaxID=2026653 RepID=A0ABW5YMV8_9FLAO